MSRIRLSKRAAVRAGSSFEAELHDMHAAYCRDGRAFIQHSPQPYRVVGPVPGKAGVRVVFTEAGVCDYTGWLVRGDRTYPVHFDAKVVAAQSGRWGFERLCHGNRRKPADQADALTGAGHMGAVAFVLIAWPQGSVVVSWRVLAPQWCRWYRHGGAPASLSYDEAVELGERCSHRADWLPAALRRL